jgi:Tfp pilus assembly protein PilW
VATARNDGVSLIELTIAMALLLALTAGVVAALTPAQGASSFEADGPELQQRLRVAADTLFKDLAAGGAGPSTGRRSGALLFAVAPLLPFRHGGAAADPPGTFAADRLSILSVPAAAAWTTLAADLVPGATTLPAARETGCAVGVNLCGFAPGMTLLVYDANGGFEAFTLATVDDASVQLQIASRPDSSSGMLFRAGSTVVEGRVDEYFLKAATAQLMHGDGTSRPDTPTVDHVVGLAFEYFGEPRAPALIGTSDDPAALRTTYGPKPPALDARTSTYPPGENCVFQVDATEAEQVPRLPDLSFDPALVSLTAEQLTDGPWCPDAISGNRWDADLLRIRSVVVTVRVESALAALRGPASALFANGGLSRNPSRWMPDVERKFTVSPPNLNVAR